MVIISQYIQILNHYVVITFQSLLETNIMLSIIPQNNCIGEKQEKGKREIP